MAFLVIGLNHKTAPVEVRECFSLTREVVRDALLHLDNYEVLTEAVILSTCNRCELYAVADDVEEGLGEMKEFLFDLTGADETTEEYLFSYAQEDAATHLFRVAASLDSLVIGEGQILSQVKAAYTLAKEVGATSTELNLLFHHAIALGKRVRTETKIAFQSVSVSYAAVELAKTKLGELTGKCALLFGAGKMARLTAEHLKSHSIEKIFVANRSFDTATALANEIGGEAINLKDALAVAKNADIIVTSTGAPHYIIRPWETRKLMAKRRNRPLFIIDIAVPRDVDPEVAEIQGVTLYNIDALESVVDDHIKDRENEAAVAEKMVAEEVDYIVKRLRYLTFRPLMAELAARAETIREREVRRALSKFSDMSESDLKRLNQMTRMIVRKLLRLPMMELNASAGTVRQDFYINAMRSLFRLENIGENTVERDNYRYANE
ncbi:MAG: glutamyl-tRNA reductase [Selenomonadaceae bacterium]|nr:glutamyl-tRNA reductase [Selenomonadaceae bacterium]MBP3721801.1 glutamyl-tRNA reductase [Selenomonadaceae bacterium]